MLPTDTGVRFLRWVRNIVLPKGIRHFALARSSNWSPEDLDLVGAAHILFKRDGAGELQMVAIEGTLDYRISHRDGESVLEFSWAGFDQGDEVGGRGTARIEHGILKGELFVHQGDNATFAARRED